MKIIDLLFYGAAALIFYCFQFDTFMMPFHAWLTAIHEMGHAYAAVISGGSVSRITLNYREGMTWTSGGFYPLVSVSGYLFTSLFGALLLSQKIVWQYILCGLLLVSILLWSDYLNFSTWFAVGISVLLLFCTYKLPKYINHHILGVLSAILCSQSISDFITYTFYLPYETDPGLLAKYLHLPFLALPLGLIYAALSLLVWFIALKRFMKSDNTINSNLPKKSFKSLFIKDTKSNLLKS